MMLAANIGLYFGLALLIYAVAASARGHLSVGGYLRYVVPIEDLISRTTFVDICFYGIGKLAAGLQRALSILITLLVADGARRLLVMAFGSANQAPLPLPDLVACYLITFLVGDLVIYATHRLMHAVPVLWELHKVHHSATFLSPFTKYRQHPLDDQINNLPGLVVVGGVVATIQYFYAFSDTEAAVMLAMLELIGVVITLDPFRHSHIPVSFGPMSLALQSPNMHRLHHSLNPDHFGRNFGQRLSVWDWIFGTAMVPRHDEPLTFGVGGGSDHDYDTIVKCYVTPVVRAYQRVHEGLARKPFGTLSRPVRAPIDRPETGPHPAATAGLQHATASGSMEPDHRVAAGSLLA